jgi:hypothetical protein
MYLQWQRSLGLAGISLILSLRLGIAATATVTVTQRAPIEALSPTGDVTGVTMSSAGAHFTLVSVEGSKIVVQDAQGVHYRLALASTDYVPAPKAAAATTNTVTQASAPPTPTPTPLPLTTTSPASPNASSSPDTPISDDTLAPINKAMGKPFFTTENFWKESGLLIANRLGLKLEDKTKWETAYRRYFYDERGHYAPVTILGGTAYCVALYADANDNPTSALIAFTNDGDYKSVSWTLSDIFRLRHPLGDPVPDAEKKLSDLEAKLNEIKASFEPDRQAEQTVLTDQLTTLFGDPKKTTFGSDATTREDALRWDWNGMSFLLTCMPNKYNLLRIIPTALADNHGRTERIPRVEIGAKLGDAVEHRPNGDVVITQIPMADQGLKGYCVPATWERILRYTGVPGDMYTLSRVGGAGFGGGAWGGQLVGQLDETLHNYGRSAAFVTMSKIDSFALHDYIDKGVPIFWSVNPGGYEPSEQRYALASRDKDWDEWKKLLEQTRDPKTKPAPIKDNGGHQVLIIGYNPETKEIAWTDPWGRETKEQWMTEEEAQRCSLGDFYVIRW